MLLLTKKFRFEMAHAIFGHQGPCRNIHGHSYELQVTVAPRWTENGYIEAPGFILDFKELKGLIVSSIVELFDHKLILSKDFISQYPAIRSLENLLIWSAEPTAENLLLYMQMTIREQLPEQMELRRLRLYETRDSYADWENSIK